MVCGDPGAAGPTAFSGDSNSCVFGSGNIGSSGGNVPPLPVSDCFLIFLLRLRNNITPTSMAMARTPLMAMAISAPSEMPNPFGGCAKAYFCANRCSVISWTLDAVGVTAGINIVLGSEKHGVLDPSAV